MIRMADCGSSDFSASPSPYLLSAQCAFSTTRCLTVHGQSRKGHLLVVRNCKASMMTFNRYTHFLWNILQPLTLLASRLMLMWTRMLELGINRITKRKLSTVVSTSRVMLLTVYTVVSFEIAFSIA